MGEYSILYKGEYLDNSLELGIEHVNCRGDLRLKLLKSFYNGHTITENYLNGRSIIHIHCFLGERQFCITFRPDNTNGRIDDCEAACAYLD